MKIKPAEIMGRSEGGFKFMIIWVVTVQPKGLLAPLYKKNVMKKSQKPYQVIPKIKKKSYLATEIMGGSEGGLKFMIIWPGRNS